MIWIELRRLINKICAWIGTFGIALSLATFFSHQANFPLLIMGFFSWILAQISIDEELQWELDEVASFEKFIMDIRKKRPITYVEETVNKEWIDTL